MDNKLPVFFRLLRALAIQFIGGIEDIMEIGPGESALYNRRKRKEMSIG